MAKENERSWAMKLRGLRHNSWLMTPVTCVMLVVLGIAGLLVIILRIPALVVGVLVRPLLSRMHWAIEFLYPWQIAKWGHMSLIRIAEKSRNQKPDDVNKGCHSRAIETRIEVLKDRVYIHPIPQLLDNLGYLVVCLPRSWVLPTDNTAPETNASNTLPPIVSFIVDCGDADAVVRQVGLISTIHYGGRPIEVHSILSTHKHHDHTAGNYDLMHHVTVGKHIKFIFGGAIEEVPHCNHPVVNGYFLPLPASDDNDMNESVEVEVVSTPAHTRGSVAYVLRTCDHRNSTDDNIFIFTGDTMFSGGGGVPFEADTDNNQEENERKMTADSFIKASASVNALQRCFSEILFRSVKYERILQATSDRLLIFPGHDYTNELLSRQIVSPDHHLKWKNLSPAAFFETMGLYYVVQQRRSLPQSSGKILSVPSSIRAESVINPHFRKLMKRGEFLLQLLRIWNKTWAVCKVSDEAHGAYGANDTTRSSSKRKSTLSVTKSSKKQWNLTSDFIARPVFTTVYSEDYEGIIDDLRSGKIDASTVADRLEEMKGGMMHTNIVLRRPIPATLPSDKSIYKGLLGFTLLGSGPTGLTLSDSHVMKINPPITSSSDNIRVSKRRLISVLYHLGLLDHTHDGKTTVAIIDNLWKETLEYHSKSTKYSTFCLKQESKGPTDELNLFESSAQTTDIESPTSAIAGDEVTLGSLKWIIYGIPDKTPTSFSFCMPCSSTSENPGTPSKDHPAGQSNWETHTGEFVRHDLYNCKITRGAVGFRVTEKAPEPAKEEVVPETEVVFADTKQQQQIHQDQVQVQPNDDDEEDSSLSFEVLHTKLMTTVLGVSSS